MDMSEPLPVVRAPGEAHPALYERIGIVGLGLIGGSVAQAARRRWPASLVVGVDRKDIIERAMLAHMVDVGAEDLGMVADVDLVVLAAPIKINERLLVRELPELITRQATITDVGGTKRGIVRLAAALPPNLTFIAGHPMAGGAASGLEHARADLFEGRPWIVCPAGSQDVSRLKAFLTAIGARCVEMSAEEHDRIVAFLSHLPQLTASALMHVIGEGAGQAGLSLAGRGLMDTTRLAGSPADIWKDVCATNADNLQVALDQLIAVLHGLREDLARGEALERVFESARRWKAVLKDS